MSSSLLLLRRSLLLLFILLLRAYADVLLSSAPPPHLFLLRNTDSLVHHCHAVLISPTHLLTPAHCYDPSASLSLFHPSSGTSFQFSNWTIRVPPRPHPVHPSLLSLPSPVPFTPLLLNSNPSFPPTSSPSLLLSFRPPTYPPSPSPSPEAALLVASTASEDCRPETCAEEEGVMCVTHEGTENMCGLQEDQSVVAKDDDGKQVLVALGAKDEGRCAGRLVGKYQKVDAYLNWLREKGVPFEETKKTRIVSEEEITEELNTDENGSPRPSGEADVGEAQVGDSEERVTGSISLGAAIGAPIGVLVGALVVAVAVVMWRRR